jgi:hypothetical protein
VVQVLASCRCGDVDPAPGGCHNPELESRADRLTQQQAALLGVTRLPHRVEVSGGAGSGKTVMALS